MDLTLQKSTLKGVISAIPSKSYCHRALIMASRAVGETRIIGLIKSQDVMSTCRAITSLGASINWLSDSDCVVTPIRDAAKVGRMDVGESGSTLRFILPQVATLGVRRDIVCHGRLSSRDNTALFELINSRHGAMVVQSGDIISASGCMRGGVYTIRGDVSSQYISGLLMALSACGEDVTIIVEGVSESQSYIDITIEVMAMYCIVVDKQACGYHIAAGQTINAVQNVVIEGDWSNAAPWLVAAAIGHNVGVKGLMSGGTQGDQALLDALVKMGSFVGSSDGVMRALTDKLRAINFSVADCPDLAPVLAVAMAVAEGVSRITDCERLRIKESDRIEAIIGALTAVGIKCYYDGSIVVHGGSVSGGEIDSHNDHRIVMMALLLGSVSSGKVTIHGVEAINKSYPHFVQDFVSVGGLIDDGQ